MTTPEFSAVLLAAGRSSRMGCDKALLTSAGRWWWQNQREILVAAGATEIFLSARAEQSWSRAADGFVAVVYDAVPEAGPLAGIVAGLERARHSHLAVLAIDLPQMQPGWFATLLRRCAAGCGAVGRRGENFEPLAAIYPRELLPLAREALAGREFSLQHLVSAGIARGRMHEHEISAVEAVQFENWNERNDLLRSGACPAAARLNSPPKSLRHEP